MQPAVAGSALGAAPWSTHIRRADRALAEEDVAAAEQAWHDAYMAALRSLRWEGLIEAGAGALRVGKVAEARGAYWAALLRAREQKSVDGVLQAAERFAALGDREVALGCVRIAEPLAVTPETRARARGLAERLTAGVGAR